MLRIPTLPQLDRLPVYLPGRPIDEVARELGLDPRTIVKLASNENPLGPSPRAIEALHAAAATVHLYPDGSSFHLKHKLAQSLGLNPNQLSLGNGSNEILELTGHLVLDPAAEVVISRYSFAVYPIVTQLFGARLVTVPDRNFGHDLRAMAAAITPNTRIVFAANPNNPTGTLAPPEDLLHLIDHTPPHVLLVVDEAYIEFLDQPLDLLPRIRSGQNPNLLLTRTFSKIHGLAGLRIGYGIGHPDLIALLEKVRPPFNANSMAQAAALAALDDTDHLQHTRAVNRAGLAFFQSAFRDLGLPFVPSHANFVLVQVGDGPRVFADLQRRGFITRPVASYGLPDWLRITVGTESQNQACLAALRLSLSR